MIGKLSGIIDSFDAGHLILDVSGVGYLVQASSRTLSHIGQVGDVASLLIITNVREDAITLYGFVDAIEKEWFSLLTSVQGVGAKAGLSILAACPPDQLGFVIASGDKAALTRADGVGPKIATRILTELKDKAGKISLSSPAPCDAKERTTVHSGATDPQMGQGVDQDAVSALTNLGYASAQAYAAVVAVKSRIQGDEDASLADLIRLSLQELSA